jgi:hypothetical protein
MRSAPISSLHPAPSSDRSAASQMAVEAALRLLGTKQLRALGHELARERTREGTGGSN